MGKKIKLFSISIDNCRVDTFTVGGHGGSGKDTSNTGVRIFHPPSGATGLCVDTRSQLKNKQIALKRLATSKEFIRWCRLEASRLLSGKTVDQQVEEAMDPKNIKVEGKDSEGRWTEI